MSQEETTDPNKPRPREPAEAQELREETAITGGTAIHTGAALQRSDNTKSTKSSKWRNRVWNSMIKELGSEKYCSHGEHFNFKYGDVLQVLINIKMTLMADDPLVKCEVPCVIVGDIHGQYTDLHRLFSKFKKGDTPGWLKQRYVFLGDYIDRGRQSLEVIIFVFLLKIRFPKQFFLLRGNHECKAINRVYGFLAELTERFDKELGTNLFHMFNEAFTHLPFACLVGRRILCMHGGISKHLKSLDDIMKIPKPLIDPNSNLLACDLLWADPMRGLKGFTPNAVRGVSCHFGEDALEATMLALDIKLVVRGHQMMMNGFNFFGKRKTLVTVFTAPSYYPDRQNRGAAMSVNRHGHIGFHILVPLPGETNFRADHTDANDADTGFISSINDGKNNPTA